MAARTIPCRVCGKPFVPCNKTSRALGAFNYREVACSPECGSEYFRRVEAARQQSLTSPQDAKASTDDVKVEDDKKDNKRSRGHRRELPLVEEFAIFDE